MTLSAPSLFAAATRASMPPRACALVAEAAETPLLAVSVLELLEDGGEQAATPRLAATAASAVSEAPRRPPRVRWTGSGSGPVRPRQGGRGPARCSRAPAVPSAAQVSGGEHGPISTCLRKPLKSRPLTRHRRVP